MENISFDNELVKSIITMIFGVFTGIVLFWLQERTKRRNETKILLNALYAEVTTLISFLDKNHNYIEQYGEYKLEETYYIKVDKNYCKIYDENAGKIGLIGNKKLIKRLVNAYTLTKILFDELQDLEFVSKREIEYHIQHPSGDLVLNTLRYDRKCYLQQIYHESKIVKKKLLISKKILKTEASKYK